MRFDWDIRNVLKCIKMEEEYTVNSLILLTVLGLVFDALLWGSRGRRFKSFHPDQGFKGNSWKHEFPFLVVEVGAYRFWGPA